MQRYLDRNGQNFNRNRQFSFLSLHKSGTATGFVAMLGIWL